MATLCDGTIGFTGGTWPDTVRGFAWNEAASLPEQFFWPRLFAALHVDCCGETIQD